MNAELIRQAIFGIFGHCLAVAAPKEQATAKRIVVNVYFSLSAMCWLSCFIISRISLFILTLHQSRPHIEQ